MPKFIPVLDPEVPRSEQDPNSAELMKHRKWDNPHLVYSVPKTDESCSKSHKRDYYIQKYNQNYNRDNKRDDRFYRKPVYDEFDYAPRKKKKLLNPDNKSHEHKDLHEDKRVVKDLKKVHHDRYHK